MLFKDFGKIEKIRVLLSTIRRLEWDLKRLSGW